MTDDQVMVELLNENQALKAELKTRMTVQEAGRLGGRANVESHDRAHFVAMGKKGGGTTAKRYGREFYEKIGKKGGQTTKAKYGHEFYEEIGYKAGRRIKELIRLGKEAEAK